MQESLLTTFTGFGLAGLIGFVLGLERDMADSSNPHAGTRDFTLIALLGAVSSHIAIILDNSWLILGGFFGALSLILSGYWANRKEDSGITTEFAIIFTFFLGVLVMLGGAEVAIPLAIGTLVILSQKKTINTLSTHIQIDELQAAIKFLIISFIVLPVLPNTPLSGYLTVPFGVLQSYDELSGRAEIVIGKTVDVHGGTEVTVYDDRGGAVGLFTIDKVQKRNISGVLKPVEEVDPAALDDLTLPIDIPWLNTMLAALNPYMIWLIVVLVSMVSLVGYVMVKLLGAGAGIGLTGLIGGLASSTVTTVSFAKRSRETPALNKNFAVAILLASAIMFFRLLLEIAIVNQELMKNMAVPLLAMGGTGISSALLFSFLARKKKTESRGAVQLANPFRLKSALTFAAIFSLILMLTRLGTTYLGNNWLPLVSVISGLVDADAIAFSLSDAQRAGIISLDWASFNLVLGAISNTMVKLFFVFSMGHRQLFHQLTVSFVVISAVGIVTTLLYYNV